MVANRGRGHNPEGLYRSARALLESAELEHQPEKPRPPVSILWAGLVVGTFDAIFAVVLYKQPATAIFHSVASGLIGKASYDGGIATAILGWLLHYFIATTWGAAYILASSRLSHPGSPVDSLRHRLRRSSSTSR